MLNIRVVKVGVAITLFQGALSLVMLALPLIVTKQEFAKIAYQFYVYNALVVFYGFGLNSIVVRESSKKNIANLKSVISNFSGPPSALMIVSLIFILLVGGSNTYEFMIVAFSAYLSTFSRVFNSYLVGNERHSTMVRVGVVFLLLNITSLICIYRYGYDGWLFARLLVELAMALTFVKIVGEHVGAINFKSVVRKTRNGFRVGYRAMLALVSNRLVMSIELLLFSPLLLQQSKENLALVVMLINIVMLIPAIYSMILMPKFSKYEIKASVLWGYVFPIMTCIVGVFILMYHAIEYGSDFSISLNMLLMASFGACLCSAEILMGAYLVSIDKFGVSTGANLASIFCSIIAFYFLRQAQYVDEIFVLGLFSALSLGRVLITVVMLKHYAVRGAINVSS